VQNLLDDLKELFQQDDRLMVEGSLLKSRIIELALKLDGDLIKLLLSHPRLRQHFFADVAGVVVFDNEKFLQFVSNKAFLPDSYTAFSNKIGLTDDGGRTYLSRRRDVVLAWPYKDCALEGGQTKEDAKRDEVFWNMTLAPDDIDRLLDPKVLTNFRRINADGERAATEIADSDNLIIKGNNLLALHSLLPRFRGRVKLVYIDPPYNRGNGSFGYNDQFNHSTWLTFVRNRLEVARNLLRADGSIWINIDDTEAHYLKVLGDEIFGRENFVASIVWQHSVQGKGYSGKFSLNHNYLLCYQKSELFNLGLLERTEEHNINYSNPDNDPNGPWRTGDIRNALYRPNLIYDITTPSGKIIKPPRNGWRFSKETMQDKITKGQVVFSDDETRLILKIFLKDQEGRVPETIWFGDEVGTTREANAEIKALFGDKAFETPKPERLLQRILHIGSDEGDLVLDFFAGSGTTGAVALKMRRRFALVEQMDYLETTTIPRLEKVINGEQGGIPKAIGWQSGGSIVVCELMRWNGRYIDEIQAAQAAEELQALWERMQEQAFLSYKVDYAHFDEHADEFAQLSLADQKRFLLEVLDKNQLYVNLSEMDDADYEVSEEDKRLNRMFYKQERSPK